MRRIIWCIALATVSSVAFASFAPACADTADRPARPPSVGLGGPAAQTVAGPAEIREFSVEFPEKNFGYLIGDVVEVKVQVSSEKEFGLDEAKLPKSLIKLNDRLELSVADFRATQSGELNQYSLTLRYQIFYTVQGASVKLEIPEYSLYFRSPKKTVKAVVPPYRLTVGSLLESKWSDIELAPDKKPTAETPWRLMASLAVFLFLAVVFFGYLMVPRILAERRRPSPFRRALKQIKRVKLKREVLALVHGAVAKHGDRTYHAFDIAAFFASHPDFKPLQSELTELFSESEDFFFGSEAAARGEAVSPELLLKLTVLLRKLKKAEAKERRRER